MQIVRVFVTYEEPPKSATKRRRRRLMTPRRADELDARWFGGRPRHGLAGHLHFDTPSGCYHVGRLPTTDEQARMMR